MTYVDLADYGRTVAALVALPELVAQLEADVSTGARGRGSRVGKPGSRPPVDLGLVSDIDVAWSVVTTWARDWAETYHLTLPRPYWADVCGFLGRHWPNAAETHQAAVEFADEIAGVRSADDPEVSVWVRLSRHTDTGRTRLWEPLPGRWRCPVPLPAAEADSSHTDASDPPPRPMTPPTPRQAAHGPSTARETASQHETTNHTDVTPASCGGTLLQKIGEWTVRCPRCGAHWDGEPGIERLGRILGCETAVTVDQAAELAHVNQATIRRWIQWGLLPTVDRGDDRTWIDKRDLVLVATRRTTTA